MAQCEKAHWVWRLVLHVTKQVVKIEKGGACLGKWETL